MGWGGWVAGWWVLAVQVGAAGVAGNGLRRRFAPQTTGTPAAPVATAICALSVVVVTSLALGSIGLYRVWALAPVLVVVAFALAPDQGPWRVPRSEAGGTGATDGPDRSVGPPPDAGAGEQAAPIAGPHRNESRLTRWAAWAALAVLAATWLDRVVAVYRRGMTDGDSFMYHLPFAARFVQHGWTTGTDPVGSDAWVAFYPANVELLQAATMLPFRSDVLVPLTNLAWLALAVLAARAIGAVTGRASVAMAVVGVVLCLPVLVATQGGTARVDIATIALVLSSVAVLSTCPRTTGSVAVAGLALGLALGTKFALLPLAGTMLVAVAAGLWRRHSWRVAAWWTGGAVLASAYWYVRNWWVTGNPVPAVDLRVGPVGFAPLPEERLEHMENSSLVDHMGDPGFWGNLGRGLADQFTGTQLIALGVGLVVLATVVLLVRQRPLGVRHGVLVAALVGCAAYPFAPYSAPIAGHPTSAPLSLIIVVLNVRYLLPSLAVLLCLVPIALAGLPRRLGDALVLVSAGTTVLLWRRSLMFDFEWPTTTGDAQVAAVVAACAVGVAGLWALSRRAHASVRWVTGGVLAAALVAGAATTPPAVGDDGTLHSYDDVPPDLAALWRATDEIDGERVALVGGWASYPHMGAELGAEVDYVGVPRGRGLTEPPGDCAELADALAGRDYDVVVAQQHTYGDNGTVGLLVECLRARDGATEVANTGSGAVFTF